jgi:hypothetical protein
MRFLTLFPKFPAVHTAAQTNHILVPCSRGKLEWVIFHSWMGCYVHDCSTVHHCGYPLYISPYMYGKRMENGNPCVVRSVRCMLSSPVHQWFTSTSRELKRLFDPLFLQRPQGVSNRIPSIFNNAAAFAGGRSNNVLLARGNLCWESDTWSVVSLDGRDGVIWRKRSEGPRACMQIRRAIVFPRYPSLLCVGSRAYSAKLETLRAWVMEALWRELKYFSKIWKKV